MESQILFLSDLNFNLDVWKRELKFQESEMDYFEEKLEHIAIRDLGKEVMIRLEGFQNKIIREREVMGHLRHKIRMKKREIAQAKFDNRREPLFHEKQAALFLGMNVEASPKESCESWFEKSMWRYDQKKGGMNVLVNKETGELVGQSGLLIQEVNTKEKP